MIDALLFLAQTAADLAPASDAALARDAETAANAAGGSDGSAALGYALAIAGLLMCSAFFSGSETALTATSKARILKLSQDGDKRADAVSRLISDPERLIGAILLGNNLVNILAAVLSAGLFSLLLQNAPSWVNEEVATTAVMTLLVLIFAEVTPKSAAIAAPDRFAMVVAQPMLFIVRLLAPVTRIIQFLVSNVLKLIGVSTEGHVFSAADEIRGEIDLHHVEGRVEKTARDMLKGALDLDEIQVAEIMVHRKNITMIDVSEPCAEVVRQALESPHTRIPLWKDEMENIVGVLHAKDILRALFDVGGDASKIDIRSIIRPPYFVPESTTLRGQLDAFRQKKEHFALIVDEYGALMGLVTLEDIIEEIVGEIEDEHDVPVKGVAPLPDGSLQVDGDVTIRELNRAMDWQLPDEEAVTIAGLVIHEGQCIPEAGQVFSFHGYRFEIVKRRRNQITALRITPLDAAA